MILKSNLLTGEKFLQRSHHPTCLCSPSAWRDAQMVPVPEEAIENVSNWALTTLIAECLYNAA